MKRYAVIMAGGTGTRFWPKSTAKTPKQFLNLTGAKSQLQLTWDRLSGVVPRNNRAVICTEAYQKIVKHQLPSPQVLAEPEGRNTMAAVCWSAWNIHSLAPQSLVAILPADAYVGDLAAYHAALELAFDTAQNEKRIVCLGIKPTFAATGYGYIQKGERLSGGANQIARFIEKPDLAQAEKLIQSAENLWNAGIFVFPAEVLMHEVRMHAPHFGAFFDKYIKHPTRLRLKYRDLEKISIDVALMEKTQNGALVDGDFGWNDIGSWPAIGEVLRPNSEGGIVNAKGGHVSLESKNNIVDVTDKKFVGLIGVENLVIVETADALLVCHKDKAQEIKDLVGHIEKNKKLKERLL